MRIHEIGFLVSSDPEAAQKKLAALLAEHGSSRALARALALDPSTVKRWLRRLRDLGFAVEREDGRKLTTKIGQLVTENPDEARRRLEKLYRKHTTAEEVARALEVDRMTVLRWCRKLQAAGFPVQKIRSIGGRPKGSEKN